MLFELAFEGTSTWDSINIPRCCAAASQALKSYSDFNYARVRSFILELRTKFAVAVLRAALRRTAAIL